VLAIIQNRSIIESCLKLLKIKSFLAMTASSDAIPATSISVRNQILALKTFPDKLATSLEYVDSDPGSASFVGVMSLSAFSFAVNPTIFAIFLERKPNTIRLAFREHGVPAGDRLPWQLSNQLPDSRNWRIHTSASPLAGSNPRETFPYQRRRRLNRRSNHGAREETRERTGEEDNEQRFGIEDDFRISQDLFDEFNDMQLFDS
jgi:hypothetical protein